MERSDVSEPQYYQSNVFPGILGRTCDRPCEPASRGTRIDEKPVAICS